MEGFTYTVSHDLRTPLRGIVANARILEEELGSTLSPEGIAYLHRLSAAANKMAELVDGLLRLSRLARQELHRQLVDVSALAWEVAAEFPVGDAHIVIHENLVAEADPMLLRLVLQNLMGNALKFARPGVPPFVEVGRTPNGAFVVRDNGIGLDMAYAEKIFLPFERLHRDEDYTGTGIGLANVKRVVERHGGHVWVESSPGQGASFSFTLGK